MELIYLLALGAVAIFLWLNHEYTFANIVLVLGLIVFLLVTTSKDDSQNLRKSGVIEATSPQLLEQAQAGEVPACAIAAAQEFAVPAKLFKAMVLAYGWDEASPERMQKAEISGKYGPMGLGGPAIADMAKGLGVSESSVKQDACTNYRAAAWWYVNRSGGNQSGDEWAAVTRFYYGNEYRLNAPATERVKTIYSKM